MKSSIALLAALPVALLFFTGCVPQSCNLMYAPSYVDVDLVADDWPPGDYTVSALGDTCTVTLPAFDAPVCSGTTLSLELSADSRGLARLYLWEASPTSFDLVILVDGAELVDEAIAPVYVEDEPNGKGCGVRAGGSVSVELG